MKRNHAPQRIRPQTNDTLGVLAMALLANAFALPAWGLALQQLARGEWLTLLPLGGIGGFGLWLLHGACARLKAQSALGRPELQLTHPVVPGGAPLRGTLALNRSVLNRKRPDHAPFTASVQLEWHLIVPTAEGAPARQLRWQSPKLTQFVPRELMQLAVEIDWPRPFGASANACTRDPTAWQLVLRTDTQEMRFDLPVQPPAAGA